MVNGHVAGEKYLILEKNKTDDERWQPLYLLNVMAMHIPFLHTPVPGTLQSPDRVLAANVGNLINTPVNYF